MCDVAEQCQGIVLECEGECESASGSCKLGIVRVLSGCYGVYRQLNYCSQWVLESH